MRPRNSAPVSGAWVSVALSFALLAGSSAAAQVSSAPLAQVDAWGVGWIGANEGAVPATFWNNTSAKTLGPVMAAIQPRELAPSARDMLARILMSRAKGPADGADLTVERLRLLQQLGESANANDLRKRYSKTDWGKPGERLSAELALLQGNSDAACGSAKSQPAADPDWMPLRAVCATLGGDANASPIVEQIAKTNESLGVWLISALGVISSPDTKKPDGRFGSPVEAAVSVAAKLPATSASFAAVPSDIAAAVALDPKATPEQRRAAMRVAFNGGKLKAADLLAIASLKDEAPAAKPTARGAAPRPDYLAQAITASADKKITADARAAAYVAALRSAETLSDGQLIATTLSIAIKALPHDNTTLPYAEPLARAALLAGDAKLAAEWRKHLGTVAKDKQDAWATARLDLMLSYAGATSEKTTSILDRLLAAAPYPAAPATPTPAAAKAPAAADQQVTIRRIENTRALFLYSGTGRDLTAEQRDTLAAQRSAGRGVSDAAIARIYAAARQGAHAEAALAIVGQLGSDVSALSFAGLSDLLVQLQAIGLTNDANAIALESLQVWKAL
ncbi:MAG: hypothetical protein ABMA14_20270 [Hyphomonadaceae bacterium]